MAQGFCPVCGVLIVRDGFTHQGAHDLEFAMHRSCADLNVDKEGTPADDKVVLLHALRCFESFGDDRDEI